MNNKIKSIVVGIPGFIHDGIIGMADGIEALNGCNLKTGIYIKQCFKNWAEAYIRKHNKKYRNLETER